MSVPPLSALFACVAANNHQRLIQFYEKGADINEVSTLGNTVIGVSVLLGLVDFTQCLLRLGVANINGQHNGDTLLAHAINKGSVHIVYMLIEAGARVNKGMVHLAARRGNIDIMRVLLSIDHSQVNSLDDNGYTPLDWAFFYGHYPLFSFMHNQMGAQRSSLPLVPLRYGGHFLTPEEQCACAMITCSS